MLQSLNKWWLNGPYTHLHIFNWTLTCDLDRRDLNFARGTPPPNKHFSLTSKCNLDLETLHHGEHFYEVSLKSLHVSKRYAQKGQKLITAPPAMGIPIICTFFKWAYKNEWNFVVLFATQNATMGYYLEHLMPIPLCLTVCYVIHPYLFSPVKSCLVQS